MLEVLAALTDGRRAALFQREQEQVRLFASRGVDQPVLDLVTGLWRERREDLLAGRAVTAVKPTGDGALRVALAEAGSIALVPVLENEHLVGLLFVDSKDSRLTEPRDQQTLGQFARIAATALSGQRTGRSEAPEDDLRVYVEKTPLEEIARDQLLALLERHEWNISRVARLLGVTRPTIYNRLERYGIERRRVRRSVEGRQAV